MYSWRRWLFGAELLVCFLPCSLLLLVGAAMLPPQVVWSFREPLDWEGAAWMLFSVPCGIVGLCTLFIVIARLSGGSDRFEQPVAVLAGVLGGAAPLLLQLGIALIADGHGDWTTLTFTVVLPLLATAHILFLARGLFVKGFAESKRPFIGPGTWIGITLIGFFIAFVLVMQHGIAYATLEERRAYWQQHRPVAYTYYSSVSGWPKPFGLGYPKQIRVDGSELTGASYAFARGPGDVMEYPPPIDGAWTIDDLFDALLNAKRNGARVQVRFDSSTGAVLKARVDNEAENSDWDFEVQELRALEPAATREEMPAFVSRQY
jgi:hypothetical protein